jgi:hypothetical protein
MAQVYEGHEDPDPDVAASRIVRAGLPGAGDLRSDASRVEA